MNSFQQLRRQLATLSNPQTLHDLHNLAGRDIAQLVQEGFAGQHAPDGDPWLPSKAALRAGRKTLRDTGNLQDKIQWRADSRAVIIQTTGPANAYASFHQKGTKRLPKRQFLPEGDLPLPYERKLAETFRTYFKERFG